MSSSGKGEQYEAQHVHAVYEEIASHFSSTRYKPWPIVERFLKSLPHGSVGIDVGCGNGKYLAVNPHIFVVGSDRSTNLVKIAQQHRPHSVVVADALSLPHPLNSFDFAVSIAVVHHLSTSERRVQAVASILDQLRAGTGKALIYVWALEQGASRRGWTENDAQDIMVPWVTRNKLQPSNDDGCEGSTQSKDQTFLRYYHLYRGGELEDDIKSAGGCVEEAGYEKDNWWAIATRPV